MRAEVRRMIRDVIAQRLGLAVAKHGDVLYREPLAWLLTGFVLDWTAIDAFYLTAFSQDLFTPADSWTLTVSQRIPMPGRRSRRWGTAHEEDLFGAMTDAATFLDSIGNLSGYRDYLVSRGDPRHANPLVQEKIAYAGLLAGHEVPFPQLDAVIRLAGQYPESPAAQRVADRMSVVRDQVAHGQRATPLFEQWKTHTLAALKISD